MTEPPDKHEPIITTNIRKLDIESDGKFPCPKCGAVISPEDETDEIYKILNVERSPSGDISGVLIRCKCGAVIRIVGLEGEDEDESNHYHENN